MNHCEPMTCRFQDLGLIEYDQALLVQKQAVAEVIEGGPSKIFLCEHPAVFTMGRLATEAHILASREEINRRGIKILRIDRGGEITLHSPGQLVVYPILNLSHYGQDLKLYLANLEQVAIDLLGDFAILANSISGRRGVWVEEDKIVSIGIGVRKWVSYHGLAINVNTDLKIFDLIRPCGLNVRMTSMEKLIGSRIDLQQVKQKMIERFRLRFNLQLLEGFQND